MKYIKYVICMLSLIFTSCSQGVNNRTVEQVKSDLSGLVSFIPVIQAGVSLTDEDSVRSRALDQTVIPISQDTIMDKYFGTSWQTTPDNPHTVYNNPALASEVNTTTFTLRIPNTGTINGIYGDINNDFYMELIFISGTQYRVKLYVYPRNDFGTDYVYEEYLVDHNAGGSWSWSNFDNTGQEGGWITQITYYRDGTKNTRETIYSSTSTTKIDEVAADAPSQSFSVTDLIADFSDYVYFVDEPVYTFSTPANFYSSKTLGMLKGKRTSKDIIEYYTEEDITTGYIKNNVQFIDSAKKWENSKEVTRSTVNTSTNESNYMSLVANENSSTSIENIRQTATTYQSENHMWYSVMSSNLNVSDADSTILSLTKPAGGTVYTGTSTQYWGTNGEVYSYSIDTTTGVVTTAWQGVASRAISDQNINITDLENITITSGEWTFTGYYQLGELVGTYTYQNYTTDVAVSLGSIEITGVNHRW